MNESLPEKSPTILTAPLRWAGRLAARERLPFTPLGRYEHHAKQLRRHLKEIPTHHSTHDLLGRFISDLPRSCARPHVEDGRVHLINKISLEPWRDDASIELIMEAVSGEKKGAKVLLTESDSARRSSASIETIYQQVAHSQEACAWVSSPVDETMSHSRIQEYVIPTDIPGVVIGLSGLGISRISDIQGSPLEIKFYSVLDME